MSRIQLQRPHAVGQKKAKRLIRKLMRDLEDEYDFTGEWEGDVLHISRTGATGDVHILDDRVEVEVRLSLLLKPMRRVIEQHIEAELDELFPESTA